MFEAIGEANEMGQGLFIKNLNLLYMFHEFSLVYLKIYHSIAMSSALEMFFDDRFHYALIGLSRTLQDHIVYPSLLCSLLP